MWVEFLTLENKRDASERNSEEMVFLYRLLADLFNEGPLAKGLGMSDGAAKCD